MAVHMSYTHAARAEISFLLPDSLHRRMHAIPIHFFLYKTAQIPNHPMAECYKIQGNPLSP